MNVRSFTTRIKAEGQGGVAFYVPKAEAEEMGIGPGDKFQLLYVEGQKEAVVITKSINFNPIEIFEKLLSNLSPWTRVVKKGSVKQDKDTPRGWFVTPAEQVLNDTTAEISEISRIPPEGELMLIIDS